MVSGCAADVIDLALIYLRARYYDPSTGQFISRDPAVAMTREPYAYVGDNPLNATDPTGLFGWDDVTHIGGAIAGGIATGVGFAHDYLMNTQSKLDAGLGGDYGQGLQGVGQSFAIASVFTGVGGIARAGVSGCVGLFAKETILSPADAAPAGMSTNAWGNAVWGRGADEARALIGTRSADELRALGLSPSTAQGLRNFYAAAQAAGRGEETSGARVDLMEHIIQVSKGG